MCVVLHWNPLPLVVFVLFTSTALAATGIIIILFYLWRSRTKKKNPERQSRMLVRKTTNSSPRVLSSLLYPVSWVSEASVRASVSAWRRTLNSAASVVRWRTAERSLFDHEQLIHNKRWEKFSRERVVPSASEEIIHAAGIPLANFPIVRQSQMGNVIAYSFQYLRDVFVRKVEETYGASQRERYVLLLRGPNTSSQSELETKFKDVVTDMLHFKQVTLSPINVQPLHAACLGKQFNFKYFL